MYTDAYFTYGQHKTVDYLTKHGVVVFQYIFAYEGKFSIFMNYQKYFDLHLNSKSL